MSGETMFIRGDIRQKNKQFCFNFRCLFSVTIGGYDSNNGKWKIGIETKNMKIEIGVKSTLKPIADNISTLFMYFYIKWNA